VDESTPTRTDDEARLAELAEGLADGIVAALPGWVARCIAALEQDNDLALAGFEMTLQLDKLSLIRLQGLFLAPAFDRLGLFLAQTQIALHQLIQGHRLALDVDGAPLAWRADFVVGHTA